MCAFLEQTLHVATLIPLPSSAPTEHIQIWIQLCSPVDKNGLFNNTSCRICVKSTTYGIYMT